MDAPFTNTATSRLLHAFVQRRTLFFAALTFLGIILILISLLLMAHSSNLVRLPEA